jgi:hypothetical protein
MLLDRHGVRNRCVAVEPLDIPVADQGSHNPDTTAAIVLGELLDIARFTSARHLAAFFRQGRNPAARVYESIGSDFSWRSPLETARRSHCWRKASALSRM